MKKLELFLNSIKAGIVTGFKITDIRDGWIYSNGFDDYIDVE